MELVRTNLGAKTMTGQKRTKRYPWLYKNYWYRRAKYLIGFSGDQNRAKRTVNIWLPNKYWCCSVSAGSVYEQLFTDKYTYQLLKMNIFPCSVYSLCPFPVNSYCYCRNYFIDPYIKGIRIRMYKYIYNISSNSQILIYKSKHKSHISITLLWTDVLSFYDTKLKLLNFTEWRHSGNI